MNFLNSSPLPNQPAIAVKNLTKVFHPLAPGLLGKLLSSGKGEPVVALTKVNMIIEQGEIFGLVGRNGQGKTTLIKSIASLLEPTIGSVRVFGWDVLTNGEKIRNLIGMVAADERSFYGRLTGWQNLMFFARLYGMEGAHARRRILELAGLFDFEPMLRRRFQELSSGNKQRMAIIRALLVDPPLILLDEPTRSLDPIAADELRKIVGEELNIRQGKTIFITSHNLDELEKLCSRVAFISRGEIKLCATMEELEKSYFTIERVTLNVMDLSVFAGLDQIEVPFPPLEWSTEASGLTRISFKRQVGDDTLNRVLHAIIARGGKIIECNTERDGLREILDAFEASVRNECHETVV